MKHNSKLVISIVIIYAIVLLFPSLSIINFMRSSHQPQLRIEGDSELSALQSVNQTLHFNTFAENYFYNLTDYRVNNNNSCGYIAIQMLLSFYNHYWNDNLIAEQYETTACSNYGDNTRSPGTTDAFYDLLVTIGNNLGYGLSLPSVVSLEEILSSYLNQYVSSDANKWFLSTCYHYNKTDNYPGTTDTYSTYYASCIKRLVQSNNPVIVIIDDYVNGAPVQHAAIAYSYDNTQQRIIFNTGWKVYHDTNTLVREDNCIVGYIALLPKQIEHVHSQNFMKDGNFVCSCKLPDHLHKYNYTSQGVNSHKCKCYCEYETTDNHHFVVKDIKYYTCKECGFLKPNDGGSLPYPDIIFNLGELFEK